MMTSVVSAVNDQQPQLNAAGGSPDERTPVARVWTEEEISSEIYDQPLDGHSRSLDDDAGRYENSLPCRYLSQWYLVKPSRASAFTKRSLAQRQKHNTGTVDNDDDDASALYRHGPRIPLPETGIFPHNAILFGRLLPNHNNQEHVTAADHDDGSIVVRLTQLDRWVLDRSKERRGYWVLTNRAAYWLQDPCTHRPTRPRRRTDAVDATEHKVAKKTADSNHRTAKNAATAANNNNKRPRQNRLLFATKRARATHGSSYVLNDSSNGQTQNNNSQRKPDVDEGEARGISPSRLQGLLPSQEDVHLNHRLRLGLLSNLLDIFASLSEEELLEVSEMPPEAFVSSWLSQQRPFGKTIGGVKLHLDLLLQHGPFLGTHLVFYRPPFTVFCPLLLGFLQALLNKTLTSMAAQKKSVTERRRMLQVALDAEEWSQQTPWGAPAKEAVPGDHHYHHRSLWQLDAQLKCDQESCQQNNPTCVDDDRDKQQDKYSAATSTAKIPSSKLRKKKKPRLPEKLWKHLENEIDLKDVIWWLPDGNSIAINSNNAQEKLVKVHFRCSKLSSFLRSLYRWGFRRVSFPSVPRAILCFQHESFKRDQPELMKEMEPPSPTKPRQSSQSASNRKVPPAVGQVDVLLWGDKLADPSTKQDEKCNQGVAQLDHQLPLQLDAQLESEHESSAHGTGTELDVDDVKTGFSDDTLAMPSPGETNAVDSAAKVEHAASDTDAMLEQEHVVCPSISSASKSNCQVDQNTARAEFGIKQRTSQSGFGIKQDTAQREFGIKHNPLGAVNDDSLRHSSLCTSNTPEKNADSTRQTLSFGIKSNPRPPQLEFGSKQEQKDGIDTHQFGIKSKDEGPALRLGIKYNPEEDSDDSDPADFQEEHGQSYNQDDDDDDGGSTEYMSSRGQGRDAVFRNEQNPMSPARGNTTGILRIPGSKSKSLHRGIRWFDKDHPNDDSDVRETGSGKKAKISKSRLDEAGSNSVPIVLSSSSSDDSSPEKEQVRQVTTFVFRCNGNAVKIRVQDLSQTLRKLLARAKGMVGADRVFALTNKERKGVRRGKLNVQISVGGLSFSEAYFEALTAQDVVATDARFQAKQQTSDGNVQPAEVVLEMRVASTKKQLF